MKWSYDLCGAEPIIKDEPIYDAADISYGELLMLSAGTFTAAGGGHQLVTATPTTVGAVQCLDTVGICLEDKDTDSSPSVATAISSTVAGCCYGKVIINPFAVYRAGFADNLSVASSASTNEVCVTGIPASAHDGCWIAFTASAGPNFGQIRRIVTSATAGTQDLSHVANATITTADEVAIFSPRLTDAQPLTDTALTVSSTSVASYSAVNIKVVENYIAGERLTEAKHDAPGYVNKVGMGTDGAGLEQELYFKDHVYGPEGIRTD